MSTFGWDVPPIELGAVAVREAQLAVGVVHDGTEARVALFIGAERHLLTGDGARDLAEALTEGAAMQEAATALFVEADAQAVAAAEEGVEEATELLPAD